MILDDVLGALAFDLRGGDDAVALDGVTLAGDLTVLGGRGDNAVVLTDVDIAGDVTVRNRRGADTFELTGASRIGDDLTIDNRSGGAVTTITGVSDGGVPPTIAPVEIGGDVALRNRRGATITTLEHVTVGGEMGVRNGWGVDVLDLLGQTRIGGDLTISHAAGGSTTRLEGLASNRVECGDLTLRGRGGDDVLDSMHVTVNGDLRLSLRGGDDAADFWGTDVFGDTFILSGAGQDRVSIQDAKLGSGETYCWFYGEAQVRFGAGRDALIYGLSGLRMVGPVGGYYFRSGVRFAGGAGKDHAFKEANLPDEGYAFSGIESWSFMDETP